MKAELLGEGTISGGAGRGSIFKEKEPVAKRREPFQEVQSEGTIFKEKDQ